MKFKNIEVGENLKELTSHRTISLPIACYETVIRQNIQGYIPLHWHDEIQFVLVVKGEANFQINEEKIELREADGLFINSGCLHMAEEKNQSDCIYICLNVSPHFILPQELYTTYVYPYIQATNLPYLYIDANDNWGRNILGAIMKIKERIEQEPPYFEIEIALQTTFIWKNLIINGFSLEYNQTEALKNHRMKQMLNWIHRHYGEKIMLDDIASAGGLSRSECCRYFKSMLKTTPLRYVTDYRIQASLSLLQHTDANVTEIAYQVGFNSTSYFIDKFRKMMNITPLAYKKHNFGDR
ncbi:AraC family transcriptional regulator [Lentibacillus jeotgali]|uniref:AraC family transcriptional regulator n=1 Tax=Lentibacillus jeotgali TaxID=558169 RepID=UPI0002628FAA|nr:AraC family transcriptional regulator [Lentibacillus jeotgali]